MKKEEMAKGFNAWMDEYINHPEEFKSTWASIKLHMGELADGKEPTYGERCAATLIHYATT